MFSQTVTAYIVPNYFSLAYVGPLHMPAFDHARGPTARHCMNASFAASWNHECMHARPTSAWSTSSTCDGGQQVCSQQPGRRAIQGTLTQDDCQTCCIDTAAGIHTGCPAGRSSWSAGRRSNNRHPARQHRLQVHDPEANTRSNGMRLELAPGRMHAGCNNNPSRRPTRPQPCERRCPARQSRQGAVRS